VDILIQEGLKLVRDKTSEPFVLHEGKLYSLGDESGPNLISHLAYIKKAGIEEVTAVRILKAKAQHDPDLVSDVWRRFAYIEDKDAIYIDLGDETNQVIQITKQEIKTKPKPENLLMYRTPTSLPMASPEFDDEFTINDLIPFFNVSSLSDLRILLSWGACAMFPIGPYPILHVQGTAGSGKTEALKKLRKVIDPDSTEVRAIPEGQDRVRNFAVGVQNNAVVMVDNVQKIDSRLANLMCMGSTVGAFVIRSHYLNTGETVIKLGRPMAFTSIGPVTTASDLIDRIIPLHVPAIPMGKQRTERDMNRDFASLIPKLLGKMCEAIQHILLYQDEVDVTGKEIRMLDYQKRIAAQAKVWNWDRETAMNAMLDTTTKAAHDTLENSVLTKPILDALRMNGWKIQGTTSEILEKLELAAGPTSEKHDWPKGPHEFTADLAYLEPALKKLHGIEMEQLKRKGTAREKMLWCPEKFNEEQSEPAPTQPQIQRGFPHAE